MLCEVRCIACTSVTMYDSELQGGHMRCYEGKSLANIEEHLLSKVKSPSIPWTVGSEELNVMTSKSRSTSSAGISRNHHCQSRWTPLLNEKRREGLDGGEKRDAQMEKEISGILLTKLPLQNTTGLSCAQIFETLSLNPCVRISGRFQGRINTLNHSYVQQQEGKCHRERM